MDRVKKPALPTVDLADATINGEVWTSADAAKAWSRPDATVSVTLIRKWIAQHRVRAVRIKIGERRLIAILDREPPLPAEPGTLPSGAWPRGKRGAG